MSQIQVPGRASSPASERIRGLADPAVTVLVGDRGDREARASPLDSLAAQRFAMEWLGVVGLGAESPCGQVHSARHRASRRPRRQRHDDICLQRGDVAAAGPLLEQVVRDHGDAVVAR